jgi:hypothetical protein
MLQAIYLDDEGQNLINPCLGVCRNSDLGRTGL